MSTASALYVATKVHAGCIASLQPLLLSNLANLALSSTATSWLELDTTMEVRRSLDELLLSPTLQEEPVTNKEVC